MDFSSETYLVIDTVSDEAFFAVYRGAKPLLVHEIWMPRKVLSEMGGFFRRSLSDSLAVGREISRVCVAVGPGGFSGSRIGVAAAKSLAFSLGVRVSVFDHQELLGYCASRELEGQNSSPIVVVSDARRGQSHFYVLTTLGRFSETLDNSECDRRVRALGQCVLVGDAAGPLLARLGDHAVAQAAPERFSELVPGGLGGYFCELLEVVEALDPTQVQVRYVRDYQARANFDQARA